MDFWILSIIYSCEFYEYIYVSGSCRRRFQQDKEFTDSDETVGSRRSVNTAKNIDNAIKKLLKVECSCELSTGSDVQCRRSTCPSQRSTETTKARPHTYSNINSSDDHCCSDYCHKLTHPAQARATKSVTATGMRLETCKKFVPKTACHDASKRESPNKRTLSDKCTEKQEAKVKSVATQGGRTPSLNTCRGFNNTRTSPRSNKHQITNMSTSCSAADSGQKQNKWKKFTLVQQASPRTSARSDYTSKLNVTKSDSPWKKAAPVSKSPAVWGGVPHNSEVGTKYNNSLPSCGYPQRFKKPHEAKTSGKDYVSFNRQAVEVRKGREPRKFGSDLVGLCSPFGVHNPKQLGAVKKPAVVSQNRTDAPGKSGPKSVTLYIKCYVRSVT